MTKTQIKQLKQKYKNDVSTIINILEQDFNNKVKYILNDENETNELASISKLEKNRKMNAIYLRSLYN